MKWIWDERKAARNLAKHGVLFENAMLVFDDALFLSIPDTHDDDDRWRTIGMVRGRLLFVVHSVADDEGIGRIISARKATPRERKIYEKQRN